MLPALKMKRKRRNNPEKETFFNKFDLNEEICSYNSLVPESSGHFM